MASISMLGCFLRFPAAFFVTQFLVVLMEATILGDPGVGNSRPTGLSVSDCCLLPSLNKSRLKKSAVCWAGEGRNDGRKIGKENSCRGREGRDDWL